MPTTDEAPYTETDIADRMGWYNIQLEDARIAYEETDSHTIKLEIASVMAKLEAARAAYALVLSRTITIKGPPPPSPEQIRDAVFGGTCVHGVNESVCPDCYPHTEEGPG